MLEVVILWRILCVLSNILGCEIRCPCHGKIFLNSIRLTSSLRISTNDVLISGLFNQPSDPLPLVILSVELEVEEASLSSLSFPPPPLPSPSPVEPIN